MNLLRKLRFFPVLMIVLAIVFAGSVTSCKKAESADTEESSEHPAADTTESAAGDHPKSDPDHPKSDSTDVK